LLTAVFLQIEKGNPRVREALHHFFGIVGTAISDHNQFPITIIGVDDRLDGVLQQVAAIVSGCEYGNQWDAHFLIIQFPRFGLLF
jgi:hypothetical protein